MAGKPLYAVTDTETGGLDHRVHALTQISVIIVDDELNELESFAHRVIPRPGYLVDPRAAEINGFNADEWQRTGMTWDQADLSYAQFLEQWFPNSFCVGVAHNAPFDAKFLAHHMPTAYKKYYRAAPQPGEEPKAHDGWFCTCDELRRWRARNSRPGKAKLSDLAELAEYKLAGAAHEALQDTRTCLAGLRWLIGQKKAA